MARTRAAGAKTKVFGVYPFLRMSWRGRARSGTFPLRLFGGVWESTVLESVSVLPQSMQSFMALLIGFAVAGLISTGYQALTQRPASFRLLERGPKPATFAAIPFLAFAAPFIIMRNTIRGRRIEGRRFELVTIATVIAGIWSMMSGTVLVMALQALRTLAS